MTRKQKQIILDELDALLPPQRLTVSEWADTHRRLSSEASAEVGRWHTSRAAYQRGIMDAVSDPATEVTVVMSSAQIGKTEIILNALGYFIDHTPAPCLVLQPTIDMARSFSTDRFAPMVRDSDGLMEHMDGQGGKGGESTILHRSFVGGHVTFVGANSPAGLAGRPIRVLAADEVDRYPVSAGTEGNPLELARKRTTTYWNRKQLITSTPTVKHASVIEREYEAGSKEKYHVPCPHCGVLQPLVWAGIHWNRDERGRHLPDTAHYVCQHCRAAIGEEHKDSMVRAGQWVAERPEERRVRSFHISELYSPWSTWAKMVATFLKAKEDVESLRVFINTALGESWDDSENLQVQEHALIDKLEDYEKLPAGVYVLTCGVDVQDTYMVADVWGFGLNEEAWLVERRTILGTPSSAETWQELHKFLQRGYEYEDDRIDAIKVAATCIDSGGHFTEHVYGFAKRHEHERVYAVKGWAGAGVPIVGKFTIRGKVRAKLFTVGVDTAKEVLYSRLSGDGHIHLAKRVADMPYIRELTAEKQVKKFVRGYAKMMWQKIRARNEALDCAVYAMAAVRILNPAWEVLHKKRPLQGSLITEGGVSEDAENAGNSTNTEPEAPEVPQPSIVRRQPVTVLRRPQRGGGWVHGW